MATAAGRKKSLVASIPPNIDSPVANNTLLNKAASQSTSLYQQCSSLRTRLMHLQNFQDWFSVAAQPDSSRRSTDPVTQLWDVFALGVPLCYLYNLLPSASAPISSCFFCKVLRVGRQASRFLDQRISLCCCLIMLYLFLLL